MKTTLLLLAVLLYAATVTTAMPTDSCLKMLYPNTEGWVDSTGTFHGTVNPDSVLIDTCIGSSTYNHLFAKKWYSINFPRNFYPFDNVLDSGEVKGVSDISSSHPGLKNRFLDLQDTFGLIYFQGEDYNVSDSIQLLNPTTKLFFENYQDFDFIITYFTNTIDSINIVEYGNRAKEPLGVKEELESHSLSIYPNPVKDYITITQSYIGSKMDIIEIISIDGKKVLESEYKERIDVSMLTNGSYFLKINSHFIKFIKE